MSKFQAARILDAINKLDRISAATDDDDTANETASAAIDHVLQTVPWNEVECALREKESALHDAVTVALVRWRPTGRPN
jgi:hypothetical protein